jgi:cystathionine beta-lyase
MELSEILTHLGEDRSKYFHAIAPPVIQSSNFQFETLDAFRQAVADELNHHIYTRGNNPTVAILRKKLAALEGAEDALVFGSGSAAVAATIISQVKSGDHIVCVQNPYSWTNALLTQFLPRFQVSHTFVDGASVDSFAEALQPTTRLIVLESPNSLTFELQDLEAVARLAREKGITTCIDNSYASPLFQRPIEWGIDLVIHSGTKYLNGHSDVVMGVVCGSQTKIQQIFKSEFMTLGAILSPHDAALAIRGLRTLPIRMQRIYESTQVITQRLAQHPAVDRLLYPFHPEFPQYELAKKQMSGTGGLFSVYLKAENIEQVEEFFHRLQRFLLAVSWGGHESLVLPSAAFYGIPGKEDSPIPWNLVRFAIGLEEVDYLWEDLEQALSVFG